MFRVKIWIDVDTHEEAQAIIDWGADKIHERNLDEHDIKLRLNSEIVEATFINARIGGD